MFTPNIKPAGEFSTSPPDFNSLRERVGAAMRSMEVAEANVVVDGGDRAAARDVIVHNDPDSPALNTPAVVAHLSFLLDEYDHKVVHDASRLRNYVTNKLLEESANEDARIRMRALELLGKIVDVGLFTEKTEITYTNKSDSDLETALKNKLARIKDITDVSFSVKKSKG